MKLTRKTRSATAIPWFKFYVWRGPRAINPHAYLRLGRREWTLRW